MLLNDIVQFLHNIRIAVQPGNDNLCMGTLCMFRIALFGIEERDLFLSNGLQ